LVILLHGKEVIYVKKMLIIILTAFFTFALASVSFAEEKQVETPQPTEKSMVKETIKPAQDSTKEEITTGVQEKDIDESDEDTEEEDEE
jgi:hypothetical protein